MLANSKIFRQLESKSANPNYTFTSTTEQFSLGEVAAPIIVFGDHASATVNRSLVTYFFSAFLFSKRFSSPFGLLAVCSVSCKERANGGKQRTNVSQ